MAGTWSKVNTGTYLGTIGFAYLSFVMFILFFFGLVIFQSAVNEELGLRKSGAVGSLVVGVQPLKAGCIQGLGAAHWQSVELPLHLHLCWSATAVLHHTTSKAACGLGPSTVLLHH